jgi:hypothetical protein
MKNDRPAAPVLSPGRESGTVRRRTGDAFAEAVVPVTSRCDAALLPVASEEGAAAIGRERSIFGNFPSDPGRISVNRPEVGTTIMHRPLGWGRVSWSSGNPDSPGAASPGGAGPWSTPSRPWQAGY